MFIFGCVAVPDNLKDSTRHRLSHEYLKHLKPISNLKPLSVCHGETSVKKIPLRFGDVLSVRYSARIGVFVFAKLCNEFVKLVSETRDAYLNLLKVESSYISLEDFFLKLYSHLSLSSIDLDKSKYTNSQLIDLVQSPMYINHVSITSVPARNRTCAFYGKDIDLLLERVLKAYHLSSTTGYESIKRAILLDVETISYSIHSTAYDSPINCANVIIADRLRSELDASYKSKTEQDYKTLGLDCSFLNATANLEMSGMQHNSLHNASSSNLQLYTLSEEQLRRLMSSRDRGNEAYIPRNNYPETLSQGHKAVTTKDVEEIISRSFQKFNEEFEPARKKRRTEPDTEILAAEQVKRLIDSLETRAVKPSDNSEQLIKTLNDKTERMSKALDEQCQVLVSLQEKIGSASAETSTDKRLDCSADSIEAMKRDVVNKVIRKCKE